MIKGLLFDWVGVLVKEKPNLQDRREELYSKLMRKEASSDEVEELVLSFEKYKPLWYALDELTQSYKICVVNNGPKETMAFWDKHFGYSRYMKFINSDVLGIEKPDVRIYQAACKAIDVQPSEVIYMDDHSGFPEETLHLNMHFIHWTSHDKGFQEFQDMINQDE